MRDVFMLAIRSEWIWGAEREALDNVRLSKGGGSYWDWLAQYLAPEQISDPAISGPDADPDGDGMDNRSEHLFLTDPTDPADRFAPQIGRLPAGGGTKISFVAKSGRVWRVERSSDLGRSDPWQLVGDEIIGDGHPREITIPADGPRLFLRVGASE